MYRKLRAEPWILYCFISRLYQVLCVERILLELRILFKCLWWPPWVEINCEICFNQKNLGFSFGYIEYLGKYHPQIDSIGTHFEWVLFVLQNRRLSDVNSALICYKSLTVNNVTKIYGCHTFLFNGRVIGMMTNLKILIYNIKKDFILSESAITSALNVEYNGYYTGWVFDLCILYISIEDSWGRKNYFFFSDST